VGGVYPGTAHWWGKGFNGYDKASLRRCRGSPPKTVSTGSAGRPPGAISEEEKGKRFLKLTWRRLSWHRSHTIIYRCKELSPGDGYWGLFHTITRPRFRHLSHNLTTILADKSSAFVPGPSTIDSRQTVDVTTAPQTSDGTFELIVWGEQGGKTNNVTVNMGSGDSRGAGS